MSDEGKDESAPERTQIKKTSVAKKLIEGIPLPDDVKNAVKQLAQAQGKSEQEVIQELVTTGVASSNEEIMLMLARRKVLGSITLDEAEIIMKKIGNVFGTWTTTPHPTMTQRAPSTQPPTGQKDEFTSMMNRVEKDAMEGLPPVTTATESGTPNPTKAGSLGTVMLYSLGRYALGLLLKNEEIGKAIGKVIEERGGDFLSELEKIFKEGKEEGEKKE